MLKWNPLTGELDYSNPNAVSARKLITIKKAAEVISANLLVYLDTPTTCRIGRNDGTIAEASVIGVTLNAGVINSDIKIQILGIVEDGSFSFNINDLLFLGKNGLITDLDPSVDPTALYLTRVGYGINVNGIVVSIEKPLIL